MLNVRNAEIADLEQIMKIYRCIVLGGVVLLSGEPGERYTDREKLVNFICR